MVLTMKTQKPCCKTGKEPVGNICVIRDDSLRTWSVMICRGMLGDRTPLAEFSTRGEAEDFARAELARLNAVPNGKIHILHVDDCPCWQHEL